VEGKLGEVRVQRVPQVEEARDGGRAQQLAG
jgi:hypothetical protein